MTETPYQDPEWQTELDRIAPPNGKLSWLHMYFELGYEWEPVGRWMVAQIVPGPRIARFWRDLLEGPNPAEYGYFEHDSYGQKRWVSELPGITRQQWAWYQEHGTFFRPYFVVQGTRGGHRLQFNHWERRIIEMGGGDPNPPAPGDLPYAEPDRRTFDLIAARDLLRKYSFALDHIDRNPAEYVHHRNGERLMREKFWEYLQDQIAGYAEELEHHIDMDAVPTTHVDYAEKLEELEESFITEGA